MTKLEYSYLPNLVRKIFYQRLHAFNLFINKMLKLSHNIVYHGNAKTIIRNTYVGTFRHFLFLFKQLKQ